MLFCEVLAVKTSVVISGLHSEGLKGWGKVGEDFSRTGSSVSANHSSSLIFPFLANFLTCMPHLFLVGFTSKSTPGMMMIETKERGGSNSKLDLKYEK